MKFHILRKPRQICTQASKKHLFICFSESCCSWEWRETERWPFYLLISVLLMLNGIYILLVTILLYSHFICWISHTFYLTQASARKWDTSLIQFAASVQVSHLESKDNDDIWHRNVAFWAGFSRGWDLPFDKRVHSPKQWLALFIGWDTQVGSLFLAERYWFVSLEECTVCLQNNCYKE